MIGFGRSRFRAEVVEPDEVAGRVARRQVLDEVEEPAVGGERVEAEVPLQGDQVAGSESPCVEHGQGGGAAGEALARVDEDERAAVGREAAGRAVVGDRRDGEPPVEQARAPNLAADRRDRGDHGVRAGRERDVARSHRTWGGDAGPAEVDALDREPVRSGATRADRREQEHDRNRHESVISSRLRPRDDSRSLVVHHTIQASPFQYPSTWRRGKRRSSISSCSGSRSRCPGR